MGAEWAAVVSTLLGAGIGVGAALLTEKLRHKRETRTEWYQTRRELYAAYLAGLSHAHGEIRAAAYTEAPPDAANSAVQEAFRESGIYPIRQQVALIAPRDVARYADETFHCLLGVRDTLRTGVSVCSEKYEKQLQRYRGAVVELRDGMRIDLGVEPLHDEPLSDGVYAEY